MHVAVLAGLLKVVDPDWFEAMRALDINSVELTLEESCTVDDAGLLRDGEEPFDLRTSEGRAALKGRFDENGAIINAFMLGTDFAAEDLKAETDWLVTACEAAEEMGLPAVRVDCLPHREMDGKKFEDRCVGAIRTALKATSRVKLGMENHGHVSNRPEFIEKMLGRVGDGRMGLTLDTGNLYWFGHPLEHVYEIMERFADRVCHTHVKNISFPAELRNVRREIGLGYAEYACPVYEGDVDHRRVVRILKAGGYDGDLSLEDESLGKFSPQEQKENLRKSVEHLKSCL